MRNVCEWICEGRIVGTYLAKMYLRQRNMTQALIRWMVWHEPDRAFMAEQVWRALKRPDGLSLALRALYLAGPAPSCSLRRPWCTILFPPLPHHFSLLHRLWSVAIRPWDYHFLFRCFLPFSSSLACLALIKPGSAPRAKWSPLMDGSMEH